jgi:pimeloyl-ACP methyl ester carboxylesterase
MIFSRKDIRPAQTRLLLGKGFLPVSLDYRLCPEATLGEGAMVDVCDALDWARNQLPNIQLQQRGLQIDGEKVVVVGWSSGGQLAMSLAWTAPQRGLRPPEAILAFYAPTDYEDDWWQHPIHPIGAAYKGQQYDLLEGVQEKPITNYGIVGAWEEPISEWFAQPQEGRSRAPGRRGLERASATHARHYQGPQSTCPDKSRQLQRANLLHPRHGR